MDQLRADVVLGEMVATPSLDHLRSEAVTFERHYAQAAPCAPGRAALYTGTYQMTNRVVANGTPLDARLDNVALLARRHGYDPVLFGYTDQGVDPRTVEDSSDPRLDTYEGVLPGLRPVRHLPESDSSPWITWLVSQGYDPGATWHDALRSEPDRSAELSQSAYLTSELLGWLDDQDAPWFVHLSYLRPHPPYAAAGEFAERYDPADCGGWIEAGANLHPLHAAALGVEASAAPTDPAALRSLRSQYFGMASEVDAQLGRVLAALKASGEWDRTIVVLTADHGEQLGDHGLIQKLAFFEQSYAIPCIIRDPRHRDAHGTSIRAFTEAVDVFPTIAELLAVVGGEDHDRAIPLP